MGWEKHTGKVGKRGAEHIFAAATGNKSLSLGRGSRHKLLEASAVDEMLYIENLRFPYPRCLGIKVAC